MSYEFEYIFWSNSLGFSFKLQNAGVIPADRLPFLTLYVGNVALKFGDANVSQPSVYIWSTHRNLQTAGVPATLRIVDHSTDATLRDLTATANRKGPDTFEPLALGRFISNFSPSRTAYALRVEHTTTHVKLRPTANDPGTTVKVGPKGSALTALASGAESAPLPIAEGVANELLVEVTAADGTTKETYTVTVRHLPRPAPVTRPGDSIWGAWLVPASEVVVNQWGCSNSETDTDKQCSSSSVLSDNDFTFRGVDYEVTDILSASGAFGIYLDPDIPEDLRPLLTLYLFRPGRPDVALNFGDAGYSPPSSGVNASWAWFNPEARSLLRAGEGVTLALHAQELPPLTPHPDGLTALTVNDGVRDLKIEPQVPGRTGLGGPEFIYTVHVPPGRRSVTVKPEWTNTNIITPSLIVTYPTYGARLPAADTPAWGPSDKNGVAKEVPLMPDGMLVGEGATHLEFTLLGTDLVYRIYLIHNRDWQSTHDRLGGLEMSTTPLQ